VVVVGAVSAAGPVPGRLKAGSCRGGVWGGRSRCQAPGHLLQDHEPGPIQQVALRTPSVPCSRRFTCPVQIGNSYRAAYIRARGRRCFDHNHYSEFNQDVRYAGMSQGAWAGGVSGWLAG